MTTATDDVIMMKETATIIKGAIDAVSEVSGTPVWLTSIPPVVVDNDVELIDDGISDVIVLLAGFLRK